MPPCVPRLARRLAAAFLAACLASLEPGSDSLAGESAGPVDLNNPPRSYEEVRLGDWTVRVEKELLEKDPKLAREALARLEHKLGEALAILPEPSHATLRGLKLFLLFGVEAQRGGKDNGLEYFQKRAPECFGHLDPRMGDSVVIYSARNYVWLSEFWALKALVHEFAHAWQLERLPEEHPDILDAWKGAMARDLYRGLKDDRGAVLDRGYAAANQLEYFAELSNMFFTGCDYFPFNREELKAYDPAGHAMIRKMWDLPQ